MAGMNNILLKTVGPCTQKGISKMVARSEKVEFAWDSLIFWNLKFDNVSSKHRDINSKSFPAITNYHC